MMRTRESVITQRSVSVERVPDGTPMELPAGTTGQITQALGSSFTLVVGGQMVRLKGADADAIGKEPPALPQVPDNIRPEDMRDIVWQTLKTCYDPEIPIDIVELGLVYDCDVLPIDNGDYQVVIKMTLTAPGCGMGEVLTEEVAERVGMLPHVADVKVDLVFDPPWDRYRLSEAAQLALGF